MKKIINKPENVVLEMCKGIVSAHPDLRLNETYKVILKREINTNKVTLISGGGSGHEPAHAGFVGKGMLDGAVCGDVFASPSQIQVYQALKETASQAGALLIIKNYSGDMMNFKNGAYLAAEDGILVDYIKVEDDIAVQDSLYTVGRRGVAGTVLVHKVAGGAAESGKDLAEVKRLAQKAADRVRSLGFAFSSCTVPAKGSPTFVIGEGEMEYGVGIHGEPGIVREAIISADELAERMVKALVNDLNLNEDSSEVTLLINGFGGSPLQELYLLNHAVSQKLNRLGIKIYRTFVGNYMTSIDMMGASVTLMDMDDELKEYMDMPSEAPGFMVKGPVARVNLDEFAKDQSENETYTYEVQTDEKWSLVKNNRLTLDNIIYLLDQMTAIIINNEVAFCELDAHAGDGDFGMSVAKGFKEVKKRWVELTTKNHTIGDFLSASSLIIMEHCGGASGPIWGSAFRAMGKSAVGKESLAIADVAEMLQEAVRAIQKTGERSFGRGAVVGDKTLIDALVPCADIWSINAGSGVSMVSLFDKGAKAATDGAKATENIVARMGRAGTVGERSLGYPDAGAYGLSVIFTDLADRIKEV